MSARDLARFALLYLNDGKWRDHQIVAEQWIRDSTRAYSQSSFGPGYGYLWWTGFAGNDIVPIVKLPRGSFYAVGAGGQFAVVMPAYDLIVVNLAPHLQEYGVSLREMGRLLWLVVDAGGFHDIGPDASIEAARRTREGGDDLTGLFPGKTLIFGDGAPGGPYRMRLDRDGSAVLMKGPKETIYDSGSWRVDGNRFCREWETTRPQRACLAVVRDQARVELFDDNGLMVIDARLAEQ